MSIHLMQHNIPSYEKLIMQLQTDDSVAIVQATGTGKSYIALNYIEHHCPGNITIVVPTNVLADYWMGKAEELSASNITVYTYSTLAGAPDEQLEAIANNTDLFIIDEMHRAGAALWGLAVKKIMNHLSIKNIKTIGMTATPIRSLDNNRNVVDELFNGRKITGVDLKDAIIDGILPPFEYVTALYGIGHEINNIQSNVKKSKRLTSKQKETYNRILQTLKLDGESSENINAILNKHLDMSKTQKIILFARDIQDKNNLQKHLEKWFPNGKLYDIDSTMSRAECAIELDNFNNANSGIHIISTVDKLNEGVHMDGVTSLIMLRKTQSNIIFFQQLGRALDAANKSRDIVVFDFVGNHKEIRAKNSVMDFIGFINDKIRADGKSIIMTDYTVNIIDMLNEINERLTITWTDEENDILRKYYLLERDDIVKRLVGRTIGACNKQAFELGLSEYTSKSWTTDENDILLKYYPLMGDAAYKKLTNRTRSACDNQTLRLGLRIEVPQWSPDEDIILKKYYISDGEDVYKRFSNRTKGACIARLKMLGLYVYKNWTDEELNILHKYYPLEGKNVSKRLPRRTTKQCIQQAYELKIKKVFGKKINAYDGNSHLTFDTPDLAVEHLILNKHTKTTNTKSIKDRIQSLAKNNRKGYGFIWSYVD